MHRALLSTAILITYLVAPAVGQDHGDIETVVRLITDRVLDDATFRFVDPANGGQFDSPEAAPKTSRLQPESAFNDWRYWNGVLNLAMLDLSEVLDGSANAEFATRNVAFGFDNAGVFKARRGDEKKWSHPFGQHFIMGNWTTTARWERAPSRYTRTSRRSATATTWSGLRTTR